MSGQRYRSRTALVAAVAIVALVAAACGDDAKKSSTGGSGSSTASASPIKLGIAVPIRSHVDYSEAVAAAKAAARAINAKGGVDGHPIEIVECNTTLNPTKEQACARQLISDKVAATVGNANYTAEQAVADLYRNAGIAQVGNYPSGISETDANSSLFFGGQVYANAGQAYAASQWGGKRIGVVRLDFPYTKPYPDHYKNQCEQLGCEVVSVAVVPSNDTADLSPYASTLLRGQPDVIVPALGPLIIPLLKTMDQLGYKGKIVAQDTNFTTKNFHAQPQELKDRYIISTPFPPPFATDKFPGMQQFLDEMEAEKGAGNADAPTYSNYSQTATMNAWLGVHAFAKVAADADAYDAASFKQAIDKAHEIDLMGLTPKWDPSKVNFDKLPRASLDAWYFYTLVGGEPKLLNEQLVQVTDLVKTAFS